MLIKRGDIFYNGVLFKRCSKKFIKNLQIDLCTRCIYGKYSRFDRRTFFCTSPPNFLMKHGNDCRFLDTNEFCFIPRSKC